MLSFETIANLVSLVLILALTIAYWYGRRRFEPGATAQGMDGDGEQSH